MTPLEAAKALAVYASRQPRMICMTCHQLFAEGERGHDPDCPWLAMPQIVAALEAAQALIEAGLPKARGGPSAVTICPSCYWVSDEMSHQPWCRWIPLAETLNPTT